MRVSDRRPINSSAHDARRGGLLGEVGALALVLELALLDGLDLLLLGLLSGGSSLLGGGLLSSGSGSLSLGGGSRGSLLSGGGSSGLGGGSLSSRSRLDDGLSSRSLLGDLSGLLCVGHCEFCCGGLGGLLGKQGISRKIRKWVSGITEKTESKKKQ